MRTIISFCLPGGVYAPQANNLSASFIEQAHDDVSHVSENSGYFQRCCTNTKLKPCCDRRPAIEVAQGIISHFSKQPKSLRSTMTSTSRLNNVIYCIHMTVSKQVPGDFIEIGTFKGGTCILAASYLAAMGLLDTRKRQVWVADSFQGFTFANEDPRIRRNRNEPFMNNAGGLQSVKRNFEKYGVLVPAVHFVKGWFNVTLPLLTKETDNKYSVIRLDGDTYIATMFSLCALYDSLSIGGYTIIDDFGTWPMCTRAVLEFREVFRITEQLECIENCESSLSSANMDECAAKYRDVWLRNKITRVKHTLKSGVACSLGPTYWRKNKASGAYGNDICEHYV